MFTAAAYERKAPTRRIADEARSRPHRLRHAEYEASLVRLERRLAADRDARPLAA
jgi:hypothetical protein